MEITGGRANPLDSTTRSVDTAKVNTSVRGSDIVLIFVSQSLQFLYHAALRIPEEFIAKR